MAPAAGMMRIHIRTGFVRGPRNRRGNPAGPSVRNERIDALTVSTITAGMTTLSEHGT
jgi:hypothetical protein